MNVLIRRRYILRWKVLVLLHAPGEIREMLYFRPRTWLNSENLPPRKCRTVIRGWFRQSGQAPASFSIIIMAGNRRIRQIHRSVALRHCLGKFRNWRKQNKFSDIIEQRGSLKSPLWNSVETLWSLCKFLVICYTEFHWEDTEFHRGRIITLFYF